MNGPTHSGFTTNDGPDNLDIEWSFKTGNMRLYAPPVVYDGVVYVLGPSFYALESESGKELWSYPVKNAQDFTPDENTKWHYWSEWSTPAVSGDRVFVTVSLDNEIIAFDRTPEDGKDEGYPDPAGAMYDVIWKHEVEKENLFGSRSSPVVVDDVVYVGTADGYLLALTADWTDENGESISRPEVLWSVKIGTRVDSSPAYYDDMIYIGTWDIRKRPASYQFNENDTYFYAFDSTPGEDGKDEGIPDPTDSKYDLIWRVRLGDLIWSSPSVDPATGTVFIGCTDGRLYAFDLKTGVEKWNYSTEGPIYCTPSVFENTVVFGTGEFDNSLYALDTENGDLIWRFEAGEKVGASPVVEDGIVYNAVMNSRLNALDLEGSGDGTTSTLMTTLMPNRIRATPAIADGHLFVSSWDGVVYSLGQTTEPVGDRFALSGFLMKGDSRSITISFSIINMGFDEIPNGTVSVYESDELWFQKEEGLLKGNDDYRFEFTMKNPSPGEHKLKIELNFTETSGKKDKFFHEETINIEKYTEPSFIPAPGMEVVLVLLVSVAFIVRIVDRWRR